jgi:hypothetical protein
LRRAEASARSGRDGDLGASPGVGDKAIVPEHRNPEGRRCKALGVVERSLVIR